MWVFQGPEPLFLKVVISDFLFSASLPQFFTRRTGSRALSLPVHTQPFLILWTTFICTVLCWYFEPSFSWMWRGGAPFLVSTSSISKEWPGKGTEEESGREIAVEMATGCRVLSVPIHSPRQPNSSHLINGPALRRVLGAPANLLPEATPSVGLIDGQSCSPVSDYYFLGIDPLFVEVICTLVALYKQTVPESTDSVIHGYF